MSNFRNSYKFIVVLLVILISAGSVYAGYIAGWQYWINGFEYR